MYQNSSEYLTLKSLSHKIERKIKFRGIFEKVDTEYNIIIGNTNY